MIFQNTLRLLAGFAILLALALPRCARAQFNFVTNADNTITITGYTGAGGDVIIPDSTNGYPVTAIYPSAFYYKQGMTSVIIPDSVTNLGYFAFYECYDLTNVMIGKNITKIDRYTFAYCRSLNTVTIPDSVSSLGIWAFAGCTNLANVNFGNGITSIGEYAFYGCKSLTNPTIPRGVTNIMPYAFQLCLGLTNVTIGNNVIIIGLRAFYNCSGLKSITIPASVNFIDARAFQSCSSLTNVIIGECVTNIGSSVFSDCINLHQAFFKGNAPNANTTVFLGETGMVYYLPGTTGWGANFGGWPTAQWFHPQPQILGSAYGLGAGSNGFQFTVSWATNAAVIVEASADLQNWSPVSTNTLVSGTNAFADVAWTNYPKRFYRVRSQ